MRWLVSLSKLSTIHTIQLRLHPYWESMHKFDQWECSHFVTLNLSAFPTRFPLRSNRIINKIWFFKFKLITLVYWQRVSTANYWEYLNPSRLKPQLWKAKVISNFKKNQNEITNMFVPRWLCSHTFCHAKHLPPCYYLFNLSIPIIHSDPNWSEHLNCWFNLK